MPFSPIGSSLSIQAATPEAGFAFQNGTPTIISWTAPNDGQEHRALFICSDQVTSALTGGQVTVAFTNPGGGTQTITLLTANGAVGAHHTLDGGIIGPGTTVTIQQATAVTLGAGTIWAEILGS